MDNIERFEDLSESTQSTLLEIYDNYRDVCDLLDDDVEEFVELSTIEKTLALEIVNGYSRVELQQIADGELTTNSNIETEYLYDLQKFEIIEALYKKLTLNQLQHLEKLFLNNGQ